MVIRSLIRDSTTCSLASVMAPRGSSTDSFRCLRVSTRLSGARSMLEVENVSKVMSAASCIQPTV